MTPTIVFDFDGTLALGDGPLVAFARAIADRVDDAGFVARAVDALALFESGETDYRDGYDVISRLAGADGIDAAILTASYNASRLLLGSDDAPVNSPVDLAAFLSSVRDRAQLVLATNAPDEGVISLLEAWGVAESFDAMHFSIGKPDGLVPVIREALERGPVLSVGDIVELDLAPAVQLGADTALVGSTAARSEVTVTMRGRTLADLYDEITRWVESAASPTASLSHTSHTTERQN